MALTLSDYMLDSGLWAAFNAGFLSYELTPNDIPPSDISPLNTSFVQDFAPGVYDAFPNAAMHLLIHSSFAPTFSSEFSGTLNIPVITVSGQTDFAYSVVCPNGTLVDAFVLTCPMNVSGSPYVTDNVVHATLSNMTCNLSTKVLSLCYLLCVCARKYICRK